MAGLNICSGQPWTSSCTKGSQLIFSTILWYCILCKILSYNIVTIFATKLKFNFSQLYRPRASNSAKEPSSSPGHFSIKFPQIRKWTWINKQFAKLWPLWRTGNGDFSHWLHRLSFKFRNHITFYTVSYFIFQTSAYTMWQLSTCNSCSRKRPTNFICPLFKN